MLATILPARRTATVCRLSTKIAFNQSRNRFSSSTSSSPKQPSSQASSTPQARALRSIISLYHTSENFAPVNSKLMNGLCNSLMTHYYSRNPPSPYPPAHTSNLLASTIKCLTLNKTILKSGETEQDLNPITSSHRIRAGNLRWLAVKDALCGTSGSEIVEEPNRSSRFASKFGANDWPGSSSNSSLSKPKPGLEIVEENWDIIQEMKNNK
ncbi:hypothetical protein PSTT_04557 [Puccinia striiformis]|uniref:Uncharacterized protein n=1 Tax=Puccinia striiformis TaxID=27350 RepID=A0A2S4VRZ2_9BASI|nr:hypothetical protein PSTT_04557 [Puccinia striiformis]